MNEIRLSQNDFTNFSITAKNNYGLIQEIIKSERRVLDDGVMTIIANSNKGKSFISCKFETIDNEYIKFTVPKKSTTKWVGDSYAVIPINQPEKSFFHNEDDGNNYYIDVIGNGNQKHDFYLFFVLAYMGILHLIIFEERQREERNVLKVDRNEKNNINSLLFKKVKFLTTKVVNYYNEHGQGSKHSYEYDVKGFMRHYKNGKQVWINPYTRCKGRGVKVEHIYAV